MKSNYNIWLSRMTQDPKICICTHDGELFVFHCARYDVSSESFTALLAA